MIRNATIPTWFFVLLSPPEKPGDRADAGDRVLVADAFFDEPVPNLPREDARIFWLVTVDSFLDFRRRKFRFRPADHAGSDGPGFLISDQIEFVFNLKCFFINGLIASKYAEFSLK